MRPYSDSARQGLNVGQEDTAAAFQASNDPQQRAAAVVGALKQKLARALEVQAVDVDAKRALSDYGVYSLMAVEIRNWIWREFQAKVAVFEIMGGASITMVGMLVVEKVNEGT
ncbi:putative polyketide synthase protein [Rosellinia necatrix]|uniref:Putative polyketide synthase protein n=1 Tax=Rosellinia necatrix TaxID=77044 RepID=A0A1S8A9K8_ROSNE|nr:putative polyketide synthase protein [Rosellinia necatrix]